MFAIDERTDFETPFLDSPTFSRETFEAVIPPESLEAPWAMSETPFQNDEFLLESENSQLAQSVAELLQNLKDTEFDEALYEMAAQAQSATTQNLTSDYLPSVQAEAEIERMLTQHFAPLATEAHHMYERMGEGLARYDLSTATEVELEAMLEQFSPDTANLTPEQQNFLGKLFNKAKQAVSGAVNLARKGISAIGRAALGPLLGKLKALVMPLLKRVIRFAMSKLPAKVRPIAQSLARKLFGGALEISESETPSSVVLSTESPVSIQQEYDFLVAEAMISVGETEAEAEVVAEQFADVNQQGEDPITRLYEARDTLAKGLMELEAGQDPTPLIQQFLPAALIALQPVIRTVIAIIGREKVVDFIAGLLAKLVSKWVGEGPAKMLATPVVSAGLGLLGFETPPNARQYAAEVLAQTLQETVVGLAQQPESIFESPVLTQVAAQEAFEQAAAANFPPEMLKLELREAAEGTGAWVLRPTKQRRKYYKKYSQVKDLVLTRKLCEAIKVFGNVSLADHLETSRVVDFKQPIRVKLHLYELTIGSRLMDIAMRERNVNGLGNWKWEAWSQIFPFTPEAATALLREPGLGRKVESVYLAGPYLVAPGQRFYYLEFPAPVRRPSPPSRSRIRIPGGDLQKIIKDKCLANRVGVIVDLPKESLIIKIRLMEDNAQRIAQALKRNDIASAVHIARTVSDLLRGVLTGSTQTGLTVVPPVSTAKEMMEQFAQTSEASGGAAAARGGAASSALTWVLTKVGEKLFNFIWGLIENYFKNKKQEFIAAADDAADGVTLYITFSNLKLLSVVREVMQGNYARAALALVSPQIPSPSIYTAKGCVQ